MRYLSGGESHGPCLVAIIEGLPAGLELKSAEINKQLARRQQGYGRGARMAIEKDRVEFLSGLRFNCTIGSPLTLQVYNRDWENWHEKMSPEGPEPRDLERVTCPRPGHADLAGALKYDHRDLRNVLERSSARETAMRVAVGSVARILLHKFGVHIYSHVLKIGSAASTTNASSLPEVMGMIEKSPLRCGDSDAEAKMLKEIEQAAAAGDTVGGVVEVYVTGIPPGLGSYVQWDRRLDGRLAGAMISIQAVKGVEIGSGFAQAALRGSKVHDPIINDPERGVTRSTNNAGGLEGGISNGQPILLRMAVKPIPTLANPLPSIDLESGRGAPASRERSDTCAVPAAAVVGEAAAAWELAVAFREKFSGDFMEEVEAAFNYYMSVVRKRLEPR